MPREVLPVAAGLPFSFPPSPRHFRSLRTEMPRARECDALNKKASGDGHVVADRGGATRTGSQLKISARVIAARGQRVPTIPVVSLQELLSAVKSPTDYVRSPLHHSAAPTSPPSRGCFGSTVRHPIRAVYISSPKRSGRRPRNRSRRKSVTVPVLNKKGALSPAKEKARPQIVTATAYQPRI